MGVAGSGKSAVGERLAERLGGPFHDGDDLHSEESRRKMAAGIALTDSDRLPWLGRINALIRAHERRDTTAVVACSALKANYRRVLLDGTSDTRLVYLRGDRELIAERLAGRREHFFDPKLLESQFATLEEPANAITVDIAPPVDEVVDAILTALELDA